MISGSKGLNPHKLAHRWGLLTPTSYNADTKSIKVILPWQNNLFTYSTPDIERGILWLQDLKYHSRFIIQPMLCTLPIHIHIMSFIIL